MNEGYTISWIASYAGVTVDTIRVYERQGLIDVPGRRPNGYRHYPKSSIERVNFIKWAQVLGFTLKEIKELLSIERSSRSSACEKACYQVDLKINVIESKIIALMHLKDALTGVKNACDKTGNTCPIIKALEHTEQNKSFIKI